MGPLALSSASRFSCQRSQPPSSIESGLTLMELLVVIMVIGVMSGIAVTRYTGRLSQSLTVQTDLLRSQWAHFQILAITRSERLRLTLSSTQYQVDRCTDTACTSTTPLIDPSTGQAFVVALKDGATLSGPASLWLDTLGRPATSTGLISTSPAATLQLSLNGNSRSVLIAPLTGFALIQN